MKFADCINRLFRLPIGQRRKLIIVLGAGISELSNIRHPDVILLRKPTSQIKKCLRCRHSSQTYERHRAVWSEYEYNRLYSRNVFPPLAYYFVARLCADGLVRSILTTNYDSFLISIFNKDRSLPTININPVLARGGTGIKKYRSKYDPDKLGIYFIHGSLEWAQFKECQCMVPLPGYAVGTNLWRVNDKWGGVFLHDYHQGHTTLPTGEARHFIDWNLDNRDLFIPEIEAAKKEIEWAVRHDGVLLTLGFMGTHCPPPRPFSSYHEELAAPIATAAQNIPTFMVVTRDQNTASKRPRKNAPTPLERRWLITNIRQAPFGRYYVTDILSDWFKRHLEGTSFDPEDIEQDHKEKWQLQYLFLPTEAFKGTI